MFSCALTAIFFADSAVIYSTIQMKRHIRDSIKSAKLKYDEDGNTIISMQLIKLGDFRRITNAMLLYP